MRSSKELVSVIVPTLDDAHLLAPLVYGVASQDYRPLELVVVDGGSRDDTLDRLEKMRTLETKDFKIRLIRESDFGDLRSPGNARNIGVEAGRGDYLIFLDSDMRFSEPGCVRTIKQELDSYNFTKVLVRVLIDTKIEKYLASFLPSPSTHHCGYRRCVFTKIKFDPLLGVGEDKDFWFRASKELGLDMDHTCSAMVTRHLLHTKQDYLKQTAWYSRTLPRFAWVAINRCEYEYVPEVLDWLRYCAYALSGPLVFLFGFLDWVRPRMRVNSLVFRLFESTIRRYVAAFNVLKGAIESKHLLFITRLTIWSLTTKLRQLRAT